jgi:ABC-2 type transport system ATP-binding protein
LPRSQCAEGRSTIANLWEHIVRLREEHGTTIVLTTHYLDEADSYAEQVLIIDHGRVIADDSPARLKAELAQDCVRLNLREPAEDERAAALARRLPGSSVSTGAGGGLELWGGDGPAALPELLRCLEAAGIAVATAEVTRPTLDDVFLALTGRSLREVDGDAGALA